MVPRRLSLGSFVALCLVTVLPCIFSCAPKDDAEAVAKVVKEGARLAEEQDMGGIFDLTTEDFVALPGKLDRRETRRILFMAFHHYKQFKVLHPQPSVEIQPDRRTASAVFPFLILKKETSVPGLKDLYGDPKGWLEAVGENADLYRLKIELVKSGDKWLVRQALLSRFTGVGFSE
jgi:hypothetical protein